MDERTPTDQTHPDPTAVGLCEKHRFQFYLEKGCHFCLEAEKAEAASKINELVPTEHTQPDPTASPTAAGLCAKHHFRFRLDMGCFFCLETDKSSL